METEVSRKLFCEVTRDVRILIQVVKIDLGTYSFCRLLYLTLLRI